MFVLNGKVLFLRLPFLLLTPLDFLQILRAQGGLGFRGSMFRPIGRFPDSSPVVRSERSSFVLDSQPFGLTGFLLFEEKSLSSLRQVSLRVLFSCFLSFGLAPEQVNAVG